MRDFGSRQVSSLGTCTDFQRFHGKWQTLPMFALTTGQLRTFLARHGVKPTVDHRSSHLDILFFALSRNICGMGRFARTHFLPDQVSSFGFSPPIWMLRATPSTADQTRRMFSPANLRTCSSVAPRSIISSTRRGYFETSCVQFSREGLWSTWWMQVLLTSIPLGTIEVPSKSPPTPT